MRDILIAEARKAALKAYAPYSNFRVGAALVAVTADGEHIITGSNVENASYGLTLCAERNALSTACVLYSLPPQPGATSRSARKPLITHLAVSCLDAAQDAPAAQRTPCGACRQWLAELAPDAVFYIDGIEKDLCLDDLLPLAFRLDN